MRPIIAACVLLALSPAARAEGSAVSQLNGKLSVGTRSGLYGGEAELYASVFTVGARAGYANTMTAFGSRNGAFYLGSLTVYPVPNLALLIEGGQRAGLTLGQARIEYQPPSPPPFVRP